MRKGLPSRSRTRPGPWIAWVAALLAGIVSLRLAPPPSLAEEVGFLVAFAGMGTTGTLIISRLPANRIGRIFFWLGAAPMFGRLGETYAEFALISHPDFPGGVLAGMFSGFWFPAVMTLLTLLFLVFPTGEPLTPRWRWVARVAVAALGIGLLHAFQPGRLGGGELPVENPIGIKLFGPFFDTFSNFWFLLTMAVMLASIVSMIERFRRSRGLERQQLKWFGYAAVVLAADILVDAVVFDVFLNVDTGVAGEIVGGATLLLIPLAAGIAILRHRLFDIDVVINRTMVYAALAGFITLVYVGVVAGIGAALGGIRRPNLGLSLLATALVAVAFQPVRERVQRFANRFVYGERATPYESVTSFSRRMAESLSFDSVLPQMAEAAAKGVGGTRSQVKLYLPDGAENTVSWPSGSPAGSFDRTVEVVHHAEIVGEIAVAKAHGEQLTKAEEKLLQDLASQAGLAMRNLRLTGELQQKLIELRESRKRIVAAQDDERRRMQREIRDGPQEQLAKMAAKFQIAKSLSAKDPVKAIEVLDQLEIETDRAVDNVRDLARGLFPKVLSDRGLGPAVESLVRKMGLEVRLDDQTECARFDLELEASVFFCFYEALQNAAKHAPGATISIRLAIDKENLVFSVIDQGPGFAPEEVKLGSGILNMKDRIEALGGTFALQSSPARGTTISARIPAEQLEPVG